MTAPAGTDAGPDRPSLAGPDRWRWIVPVLMVLMVGVPLACLLGALTDDTSTTTAKVVSILGTLAFAVLGVATARPVERCAREERIGLPIAVIVVSTVLFTILVLSSSYFFFVSPLLYWQIFSTLPLRWSIATVIPFSVVMVVLQVVNTGGTLYDNRGAFIGAAASMAGGIVLATWIGGIIEQSAERAQLIDQLDATRSELAEAHHGAGVLAERERMAREIHDTLAQGFTSIVMLSQAAVETDDPVESQRLLGSIERTARENLAEARNLVEGSGPAVLAEGSLVGALERLAERTAADLGIEASTEVRGTPRPLPSASEVALLRAAQEAVANVRRHAGAGVLRIVLDYGIAPASVDGTTGVLDAIAEPEVTVEVRDDGRGFDVTEAGSGFGLSGMRRRLEQVGGRVEVRSAVGEGTVVRVAVP